MKYIKTFEYQVYTESGTLGKMYSGRFTDTLSKHCSMLDRRGIEYEIFVDEDEFGDNQDVVFIVIKDEYKLEYFKIFKLLGFKPINSKQIRNLKKYDSIRDYLKTNKLDERIDSDNDEDSMNYIYPITKDGYLLFNETIIEATDVEIEELKSKHLVSYYYNYDTGGGQWEYLVDNLNEIEEYLELIRTPEYKASKKYNL